MVSLKMLIWCWKIFYIFCGSDFHSNKIISKITFGSCNKHDYDQPLWNKVREQTPDLWIWLGDAVYADTRILPFLWVHSSLESMKEKFNLQKENPNYKLLSDDGVPIIGTWDDHDYGLDGVGKAFKYRFQSQNLFLDFLEVPINSALRTRKGLYSSHTYGTGDQIVKVILLDVRSHHTKGWDCEVLGEEQWVWLENQLNDNTSSVIFIGSGKQVLSDIPFIDKWMSCQSDLDRLIWLVQKRSQVLFLSGDVHFSEVNCYNATSTGYPLYEVTSSGMTHSCSASLLPTGVCDWTLKNVVASRYRVSNVVTDKSFGMIQIDWNSSPVKFTFTLIGENGIISQMLLSSDDLIRRRHPTACPAALEQPNYYWKRVFWITVVLIGVSTLLTFLRVLFLICRWIILRLLKDLDMKIKRRIKKIRLLLPSSASWKRNKIHVE
ncbi:uncharacterized protein LOC100208584 isoform X4 [Hydra vulgaris]|uniref:Uncharacterized protein LOC100208584 isoform X4 n=2 Tax=Hydra vulgaris TaxID=6087 RepID=A0ABM4D2C1_HYDVU